MSDPAPKLRQRKCPTCEATFKFASVSDWPSYPFCTERCRAIDLGSWLSEDYRVVEDLPPDPELIERLAKETNTPLPPSWAPDKYEDWDS